MNQEKCKGKVLSMAIDILQSMQGGDSFKKAATDRVVKEIPNSINLIPLKNSIVGGVVYHNDNHFIVSIFCRYGEEWKNLDQEDLDRF